MLCLQSAILPLQHHLQCLRLESTFADLCVVICRLGIIVCSQWAQQAAAQGISLSRADPPPDYQSLTKAQATLMLCCNTRFNTITEV